MHLVDALETTWKQSIKKQNTNLNSLSLYDHHLIEKKQVYSFGKLNSKELYILILRNYKNQRQKGISRLSLNPQLFTGRIFICYHVRPPLTQKIALCNTKF